MRELRHENCDRARRWASLRLDEALSELESRLLDTHLATCSECRSFEESVSAFTAKLRAADLVALERPVALPPRRRRLGGGLRVASAAAAAAGVVSFGFVALTTSSDRVQPFERVSNVRNTEVLDVRELRRSEMRPPRLAPLFTHVRLSRPDRV